MVYSRAMKPHMNFEQFFENICEDILVENQLVMASSMHELVKVATSELGNAMILFKPLKTLLLNNDCYLHMIEHLDETLLHFFKTDRELKESGGCEGMKDEKVYYNFKFFRKNFKLPY